MLIAKAIRTKWQLWHLRTSVLWSKPQMKTNRGSTHGGVKRTPARVPADKKKRDELSQSLFFALPHKELCFPTNSSPLVLSCLVNTGRSDGHLWQECEETSSNNRFGRADLANLLSLLFLDYKVMWCFGEKGVKGLIPANYKHEAVRVSPNCWPGIFLLWIIQVFAQTSMELDHVWESWTLDNCLSHTPILRRCCGPNTMKTYCLWLCSDFEVW